MILHVFKGRPDRRVASMTTFKWTTGGIDAWQMRQEGADPVDGCDDIRPGWRNTIRRTAAFH